MWWKCRDGVSGELRLTHQPARSIVWLAGRSPIQFGLDFVHQSPIVADANEATVACFVFR